MHDEDGAAILRRRTRLVALALSGMTGCVPAPGKEPPAHVAVTDIGPAMEPVPQHGPEPEPEDTEADWEPPADADPAEVAHAEARKHRPPPPPAIYPSVCLSIAPMVCLEKKAWDDDEPAD